MCTLHIKAGNRSRYVRTTDPPSRTSQSDVSEYVRGHNSLEPEARKDESPFVAAATFPLFRSKQEQYKEIQSGISTRPVLGAGGHGRGSLGAKRCPRRTRTASSSGRIKANGVYISFSYLSPEGSRPLQSRKRRICLPL